MASQIATELNDVLEAQNLWTQCNVLYNSLFISNSAELAAVADAINVSLESSTQTVRGLTVKLIEGAIYSTISSIDYGAGIPVNLMETTINAAVEQKNCPWCPSKWRCNSCAAIWLTTSRRS